MRLLHLVHFFHSTLDFGFLHFVHSCPEFNFLHFGLECTFVCNFDYWLHCTTGSLGGNVQEHFHLNIARLSTHNYRHHNLVSIVKDTITTISMYISFTIEWASHFWLSDFPYSIANVSSTTGVFCIFNLGTDTGDNNISTSSVWRSKDTYYNMLCQNPILTQTHCNHQSLE